MLEEWNGGKMNNWNNGTLEEWKDGVAGYEFGDTPYDLRLTTYELRKCCSAAVKRTKSGIME